MKKLLLAALMFAGLISLAPTAEAGGRGRYDRYDHCDRGYGGHGYRSHYRTRYVSYHRPVRYYRSYDRYDDCGPRYYHSRPRLSVSFGF